MIFPARQDTHGSRRSTALLVGVALAASLLVGAPAAASGASPARNAVLQEQDYGIGTPNCEGNAPIICTFHSLKPGHYDVSVVVGSAEHQGSTEVMAESRRLMRTAIATEVGQFVRETFTVNVREPEGQQNAFNGWGNPGLTITFAGESPHVASIRVTPANAHTQRVVLLGDSTVTDQENWPYAGWGQRIPAHFARGVSVINHSGSGESTVSMLADPDMFASAEPQLRAGDVALIQLAHNDKTTTAEEYRANLATLVDRVRARGATPVLVTPIVRHRFSGGVLNSTGLIVTALADLPAEMRSVASYLDVELIDLTALSETLVEGLGQVDSEPLYLIRVNGDRTHTSEYGATVYADIVAGELRGLGLIAENSWRSSN